MRTETTGLRKSLLELAFVRDKKLSLPDEATEILFFFSLWCPITMPPTHTPVYWYQQESSHISGRSISAVHIRNTFRPTGRPKAGNVHRHLIKHIKWQSNPVVTNGRNTLWTRKRLCRWIRLCSVIKWKSTSQSHTWWRISWKKIRNTSWDAQESLWGHGAGLWVDMKEVDHFYTLVRKLDLT